MNCGVPSLLCRALLLLGIGHERNCIVKGQVSMPWLQTKGVAPSFVTACCDALMEDHWR